MLLRTNGYQILRGLKMARRTGGPACCQVRGKEAISGSFQLCFTFYLIVPSHFSWLHFHCSSSWKLGAETRGWPESVHRRSRGQAARLRHPAHEDRHGHHLSTEALLWLEKEKNSWRPRAHVSLEVEVPEFLHRKGVRPEYC